MVHHKNPYTKLGPFKIEYVHHNPFFLIIHDLLTEEDMAYLKDWATPKLSTKRNIQENDYVRIVAKSVQEGLCVLRRVCNYNIFDCCELLFGFHSI